MSNRVDELESKVSELQAAVDGLTEELVETRARLSALEGELDVDGFDVQAQTPRARPGTSEEAAPDPDEAADAEADAGDAPPVEEANSEGDDAPDSEESESEKSDDIIVA